MVRLCWWLLLLLLLTSTCLGFVDFQIRLVIVGVNFQLCGSGVRRQRMVLLLLLSLLFLVIVQPFQFTRTTVLHSQAATTPVGRFRSGRHGRTVADTALLGGTLLACFLHRHDAAIVTLFQNGILQRRPPVQDLGRAGREHFGGNERVLALHLFLLETG